MTIKLILQIFGVIILSLVAIVAFNATNIGRNQVTHIPTPLVLSIDTNAAAQRFAEITRFQTISYSPEASVEAEAFLNLHSYLTTSFPKVHAQLENEIISDFSLLYRWPGSDPDLKAVLLTAHMDVVPVEQGTLSDWTYPPFAGTIADGYIWGRGTLDMKVSLGGILEAVEHLIAQGFSPTRTIYLAFSHDEETGGSRGTKSIVRALEERGVQLLFTLDEGMPITHGIVPGVKKPVALIGLAEKGRVTLELTAHGEGGHSSLPPVNTAVGKLGRALYQLETKQMRPRLQSPTTEMFSILAPEMSTARRVALANVWLFEPWLLSLLERTPAGNASIRTTTAPTIIKGGVKPNVLPREARAVVDFRILPGDTVDSVIEHVQTTVEYMGISIRQIGNEPSNPTIVSDSSATSYAMLDQTIRQVFPDVAVAPGLVIGRTDSRHYSEIADNNYRFLPMRLGNNDLKRIHGIDERIAFSNYEEIIRFYIQLLWNSDTTGRGQPS